MVRQAGSGEVWHGQVRRGMARRVKAGLVGPGLARQGEARSGESRQAWKARKEMMKIEGNGRKAVFLLNQQVQGIC